jgi:DNA-binding GntR family transcriptional regulator
LDGIEKIPRVSLREQVFCRLQAAIISGELKPEARVRDQELATQLGVSRTPVREAMQRLEDEGLIETFPGALTRIAPLDTRASREAFPVVMVLHALATRLGAPRLMDEDHSAMQAANDTLAAAIESGDVARAIQADDHFHGVLLKASGNRELQCALDRVMPKVRRLEFAQFRSLAGRSSVQQHQEILTACRCGAVNDAAALVEENWMSLGRLLLQVFENKNGEAT